MKLVFFPALALSAVVSSQLVVPLHRGPPRPDRQTVPPYLRPGSGVLPDQAQAQIPLMDSPALGPGPVVPPPESGRAEDPPSDSAGGGGSVILSDVMGKDRSINLFAG